MALRITALSLLAFLVAALPPGKAQLNDDPYGDPYGDLNYDGFRGRVNLFLQNGPYYYQAIPVLGDGVYIFCTRNASEALSAPTLDRPVTRCDTPFPVIRSVENKAVFLASARYLEDYFNGGLDHLRNSGGSITPSPPSLCYSDRPLGTITQLLATINKALARLGITTNITSCGAV